MSFDLSEREVRILRSHARLARVWGYRAGTNGNHTAFENRTHVEELRALQELTDIVFRNIQQVSRWGQTEIYSSDVRPKLYNLVHAPVEIYDNPGMVQLLRDYMEVPEIRAEFEELSRTLDNVGRSLSNYSLGFIAVVKAAKAIVHMSNGHAGKAFRTIMILANLFVRRLGLRNARQL